MVDQPNPNAAKIAQAQADKDAAAQSKNEAAQQAKADAAKSENASAAERSDVEEAPKADSTDQLVPPTHGPGSVVNWDDAGQDPTKRLSLRDDPDGSKNLAALKEAQEKPASK